MIADLPPVDADDLNRFLGVLVFHGALSSVRHRLFRNVGFPD